MTDLVHKSVAKGPPDRTFLDGSEYWFIDLQTARIGLGKFRPGWVWSKHVGAATGLASESHIGIIQSGRMAIRSADGNQVELGPGDAFEVGPGHDAWVAGDEPCIALDTSIRPGRP